MTDGRRERREEMKKSKRIRKKRAKSYTSSFFDAALARDAHFLNPPPRLLVEAWWV
jgi:hypothetical protein